MAPLHQRSPPAIEAVGLRKTFGATVAVADLHLAIPSGEIFGLVGPDGAGKTTSFRLLLGLLRPDAGRSCLGGYEVGRRGPEIRDLVGYVAQQFTLYADLSVAENMEFVAQLRGVSPRDYAVRSREFLELTELAPFTGRLVGALSGGMKRKLALICAMLHDPRILLLDEPTTGIDPVSRREFWGLLYGLPAQGVTVMVSTPYLDEAERCYRLGFMDSGQLLAVDSPQGLLRRMPDVLVEVRTGARRQTRALLRQRSDVRRVETVGNTLRVALDPERDSPAADGALAQWLAGQGVPPESCEAVLPTLADVFSAMSDPGRAVS